MLTKGCGHQASQAGANPNVVNRVSAAWLSGAPHACIRSYSNRGTIGRSGVRTRRLRAAIVHTGATWRQCQPLSPTPSPRGLGVPAPPPTFWISGIEPHLNRARDLGMSRRAAFGRASIRAGRRRAAAAHPCATRRRDQRASPILGPRGTRTSRHCRRSWCSLQGASLSKILVFFQGAMRRRDQRAFAKRGVCPSTPLTAHRPNGRTISPPTANHQPSTTNRQPPTANHQPPN